MFPLHSSPNVPFSLKHETWNLKTQNGNINATFSVKLSRCATPERWSELENVSRTSVDTAVSREWVKSQIWVNYPFKKNNKRNGLCCTGPTFSWMRANLSMSPSPQPPDCAFFLKLMSVTVEQRTDTVKNGRHLGLSFGNKHFPFQVTHVDCSC